MISHPHLFTASFILGALLFALPCSAGVAAPPGGESSSAMTELAAAACGPCEEFNRLNTLVRDGMVPRTEAGRRFRALLPALKAFYYHNGGRDFSQGDWVFPLHGYTARAIGEGSRHGYEPRGYDWFDGNRHKGHPSLDIFIRDKNHDDRDDRTGSYVQVLSLTGGVVVARLGHAKTPGKRAANCAGGNTSGSTILHPMHWYIMPTTASCWADSVWSSSPATRSPSWGGPA